MPNVPVVIPDGSRLKQLRKERQLRSDDLALLIGPHRSGAAIRQMERPSGKRTSVRYLTEIARALGVETAELIASVPGDGEAA